MTENSLPPNSIALVTGATGFTGQYLVKRLLEQGVRVRAVVREDGERRSLAGLPIEWVEGTLWDEAMLTAAMEGVEYVFHLASSYRRPTETEEDFYNVHVASTQALARAALREKSFKRFVHVSTVGVHGHIAAPPADETYRYSPDDIYQRTKHEAEEWIRNFASASGLPITIVRPAGIYGPGDERLFKMFKMATHRFVPMVGYGRCLYHLVHVDDVVSFLICVATHPNATDKVYICASKEPIELKSFIRIVGRQYGVKNRIFRLPAAPIMSAAYLCEWACRLMNLDPPIYPRRIAFFTKDRAFDASKMVRELGFETRIENDKGIRDVARWYVDNGWVPGIAEVKA